MMIVALICLCSALTAFSSMVQELTLAQTLSATLGGTTLRYATTVALFSFSLGLGSWASTRFKNRGRLKALLASQVILVFLGMGSPWLIKTLDPSSFAAFPLWALELLSYLPVVAVGLTSGVELPLLMSLRFAKTSTLLALDYLGMFSACLAFPFFLLPTFGVFGAAEAAAAVNFMVLVLLFAGLRGRDLPSAEDAPPEVATSGAPDANDKNWPGLVATLALIFILSACGMSYEFIVARALTDLIHDEIISQSISIGVFLLGMGAGAWTCSKIRVRSPVWFLFNTELLLAAVGSTCVILILFQATVFQLLGWHWVDLARTGLRGLGAVLAFQWGAFITGFLSGLELPLLIRSPSFKENESYGLALAWSYFGSLIGGFALPLWLIPNFGLLNSAALVALGNLIGCAILLNPARVGFKKLRWTGVCAAMLIIAGGTNVGPGVQQFFLKSVYLRLRIISVSEASFSNLARFLKKTGAVERIETPYQSIDIVDSRRIGVIGMRDDYTLYLNRQQQFSRATWLPYHQSFSIGAINLARHVPHHVLILGGGDGLLAGQLLQFPEIRSITLIELDRAMIHLARTDPVITELNGHSLDDPRVTVKIDDAFRYIRRLHGTYDAIFADFPYPISFDLARLFSVEFYSSLLKHLAPDGFVVLDGPIWRDLGMPIPKETQPREVMLNTLRAAGFGTIFPFGPLDPLLYLEKKSRDVSFDYAALPTRITNRGFINFVDIKHIVADARPDHKRINSIYRPWRFNQ